MYKLLLFLSSNLPSTRAIILGTPLSLLWAWCCLWFAGYLKHVKGVKTGYTRKMFHILTFVSVVAIQLMWGLPLVCLFGSMASLVIFYAVIRGAGYPLYDAMAREQDAPHQTYYVVIPYFATLLGGIVSNVLFGPLSLVGYLVVGVGDAAGEPIGTKWGRHPYAVPGIGERRATRTYEGSAGILIVTSLMLLVAFSLSPQLHFTARTMVMLPVIALGCTLIEAVSPHGWDNATMQILPALMTLVLIR